MVEVPSFDMPFAGRLSPHVDSVRRHTKAWVRDMGMLNGLPWTEAFYDAADYGGFAPLTHPTAEFDDLKHISDWHTWGFYLHDAFREGFLRPRNSVGGKAFIARLKEILAMPSVPATNPAEKGLADLVSRSTLDDADRAGVIEILDGLLWELHNTVQGRVPDPIDLVEMRRKTNAGELSAALARKSVDAELPEELLHNSTMRALVDSFGDVPGLRQEILRLRRLLRQRCQHDQCCARSPAVLRVRGAAGRLGRRRPGGRPAAADRLDHHGAAVDRRRVRPRRGGPRRVAPLRRGAEVVARR